MNRIKSAGDGSEQINEPATWHDGFFQSEEWHNRLLEKAEFYNSKPGPLKYYNCSICKNKGVIEYITDDWDESMKECKCMPIRQCYMAMSQSGITEDMIGRFSFKNFSEMADYQVKMKAVSQRYATSDLSRWLIVSGQSGCGKTHVCTATAKYLLSKGHKVKYVLWHDMARKCKSLKYKNEEYEAYMRDICDAEVLYIDDLFKIDKSLDVAFEIINSRYMSRKPLIISTECYINDINNFDEAIGSRIEEMTKDFCVQIKGEAGRNFRTNTEN